MKGWSRRQDRFASAPGIGPAMLATILATILAGVIVAVACPPASAAPSPQADCTATSGVILAVDFSHWGGPVLRSCGTTPTTGFALLNQGGWHTAGTDHDGPGFICRIGYAGYRRGAQFPTPAQESCVLTPPASAYWTYWQAGPGLNTWSYSQVGATGNHPAPGSINLWVFGSTSISGTSGSAVPRITPDTIRDAARTAAGAKGVPIINAEPLAASGKASPGSPEPAIIAVIIAALVAAAGITAARRRRRTART